MALFTSTLLDEMELSQYVKAVSASGLLSGVSHLAVGVLFGDYLKYRLLN